MRQYKDRQSTVMWWRTRKTPTHVFLQDSTLRLKAGDPGKPVNEGGLDHRDEAIIRQQIVV